LPEVICNTSPIQYPHQLGLLDILPALAGRIFIPPAVRQEIATGRGVGVNLPDLEALDWLTIRAPKTLSALGLITDLGPGETEVLALALESPDPVVILDDNLARRAAAVLEVRFTGTLGLLLDAKRAGLVSTVEPQLDRLQRLRFRLSAKAREVILRAAGELSR
jgi:predicted nucleic acid-binding protein